jgi:hypothetical protein
MNLILPANLNQERALDFCCELNNIFLPDSITLDVSQVRWAFPFGSLVIGSQVRRLRKHGVNFVLSGYDSSNRSHTYLAHIGFFRLLGFDIGNAPGQASGSDSYLPLTILDYHDLLIDEVFGDNPMHKAIQRKSEEFAGLLTQSHKSAVIRPVTYCIRELVRNVFEHSDSTECMLGGQRYADGRVLVGIVDYGQGLRASLAKSFQVDSDLDAIKMAIKPGISSKLASEDDDNPWANSGFGLFVLSELGRQTGYFSITSGGSLLELSSEKVACRDTCHGGTAVNIIFRKQLGTNLEEYINSIIQNGEAMIQSSGSRRSASLSSKTI